MTDLPNNGWLEGAQRRPSPHQDDRPTDCAIELLVIHNISLPPGEFGGPWIDDLFLGRLDTQAHPWFAQLKGLRVSAHLLIRRDGELIQYVPFRRRAWHAGLSSWRGRSACNDFSIGIELEGSDELPYTPAQYDRLIQTTQRLLEAYPLLSRERITGHQHIAPDRKTDPGPAFDWSRYLDALIAETPIGETGSPSS